jgi:hypothetical protein
LTGRLLLDNTLDVDDIFETVDGGNFPFPTLVGASDNGNLVVLSDRDRTDLKVDVRAEY